MDERIKDMLRNNKPGTFVINGGKCSQCGKKINIRSTICKTCFDKVF